MTEDIVRSGSSANTPISELAQRVPTREPEEGIALCLSGGGYRAMLFHTGTLWRLHEVGLLSQLKRVSSVSGGSIVAALLGLKWKTIYGPNANSNAFEKELVEPIRKFAHVTVDFAAVGKSILFPGSTSEYVADAYAEHLYGTATLQALPDDPPRFVINATNVQSGALWRFSKPYMRDYLVGQVRSPTVSLADAVAASSAFPPFLSPARLDGSGFKWAPASGEPLHRPPFTTSIYLTDGGVYDNLGLETAWKSYRTLLVSDGGQKMKPDSVPHLDWSRHATRILDVVDNQVRSLRKRQLVSSFIAGARKGAYWGIGSDITEYQVPCLPCPLDRTRQLADIPTRLGDTDDDTQERLMNWGYAICDAALRKWVDSSIRVATKFPYDHAAV
jgi:NTE family protein